MRAIIHDKRGFIDNLLQPTHKIPPSTVSKILLAPAAKAMMLAAVAVRVLRQLDYEACFLENESVSAMHLVASVLLSDTFLFWLRET